MFRIGLTGSIAAGKSLVAALLREEGVPVIDADAISRAITAPGQMGAIAIARHFGAAVMRADASIDRAALAKIVFADDEARHALEGLLHPLILQKLRTWMDGLEEEGCPVAVVDAALLIESGFYREFDRVWLVLCDDETRLKRLMKRDALTREEATLRMQSQMPQEEKRRYADDLIDNGGSPTDTQRQVQALLRALEVLG